jgi:hypothetical protein
MEWSLNNTSQRMAVACPRRNPFLSHPPMLALARDSDRNAQPSEETSNASQPRPGAGNYRLAECTGEGDGFLDQFHITEIAPGSNVKPHARFWNIAAPTTTADGRQRAGNLSAPAPVFARFPPSPPGAGFGAL